MSNTSTMPNDAEVSDFANRIADYIATASPAFADEAVMRRVVAETMRLVFGEAFSETSTLMRATPRPDEFDEATNRAMVALRSRFPNVYRALQAEPDPFAPLIVARAAASGETTT